MKRRKKSKKKKGGGRGGGSDKIKGGKGKRENVRRLKPKN